MFLLLQALLQWQLCNLHTLTASASSTDLLLVYESNTKSLGPYGCAPTQTRTAVHLSCCAGVGCCYPAQAVVKEGAGAAGRLVVKLTVEEASKGNPNFARRLLGLPELSVSAASTKPAALAILEGLAAGSQPGQGAAAAGPQGGVQGAGWAGQREGDDGGKSMRMRDGVRFGGGQGDGDDQEEEERGGSEGDGPVKKTGKVS